MPKRILRKFRINEISGVTMPAQEGATARIMKSAPASATPMTDRLAALTDNFKRGYPNLAPDEHYAAAWRSLSLSERDRVREEESGEFQRQQAEAARLRASAMKGINVTNIDTGALAMLALEGAATALRKTNPKLSRQQAFSRVYTDPKYAVLAKAEREESLGRIAGINVARTAARVLNSLSDDEIERLAAEIKAENPYVTDSELIRQIANSAEERERRGRYRQNVAAARRKGDHAPGPYEDLNPGRFDEVAEDDASTRNPPALDRLNKLAAELRERNPKLSRSQAFSKIYSDPANRSLVAAERHENRPAAT